MPAGENVTTKFKVDISDLKSNITQANKLIKLANAEFKAASAGMDDWSKSATGIQAKLKQLASVLDAQKSKLSSYEKQLDRQQEAYEENGKRADQLKAKLQELANNGVKKTSDEYKKYQTELAAVEKEQTSNEKAIDNLKITILNQQAAVKSTEAEVRKYSESLKDLGNEAKDAESKSDGLNDELGKSKDNADKSSDGFTVLKGTLADLVADGIRMAVEELQELVDWTWNAWKAYDEGTDKIIKFTGATGAQADSLKQSYKSVAKQVVAPLDEIGAAIGEVNTRFGFTGKTLEDTTVQFLKFAELNDTDVKSSIDNVQSAMRAFNIDTRKTGSVLDLLNTAGQQTGESVDEISEELVKNGTALRQMGFNISDATMFLANLNKNGVDTSSVMTGLKKAVANAAKEGKPMSTAMKQIEASIKNAKTPTEATQKAIEVFGARSGAAIADAVRSGRLSFSNFGTSLKNFSGNIDTTYDSIKDGTDDVQLAMQNLQVEVASVFDEFIEEHTPEIKDLLEWLMEEGLPVIVQVMEWLVTKADDLIDGIEWIIEKREKLKAVFDVVKSFWGLFNGGNLGFGFSAAFKFLYNHFEGFRNFVDTTTKDIGQFFKGLWDTIVTIFENAPEWFSEKFLSVVTKIREKFKDWGKFWSNLWNTIRDKFSTIGSNVGEAISSTVKSGINRLIGWFERTINKIIEKINIAIEMINKVPGLNIRYVDYVNFRRMETGGIVTRPTAAIVGENGPEAIIPLKKNREWLRSVAAELGNILGFGSGGIVNNSVSNTATTNFTQNIYAPQAPSRLELYRQTKNLLSLAESVKGA